MKNYNILFKQKTGPYTFGLGLATYLCSKEIYIMEHEFYTGLSIAIMGIYAVKKLGPATAKFLDAEVAVSETNHLCVNFTTDFIIFPIRNPMLR